MRSNDDATVRSAHTGALDPATLHAIREFLDTVFEDDFDDQDWEHALGGMHALAWVDDTLVAHGSVIQRRLLHGGRALRTGYVEAVGVREAYRGRGYAAAVLGELETLIRGAYDVGALSTSEWAAGFYTGRGWRRWQGPTYALTPAGVVRTPDDDGGVYVLAGSAPLDHAARLTCDWRDGELW